MSKTVFCTKEFVSAWCSHFESNLRPLRISTANGDDRQALFAAARVGRTGLCGVDFGPGGFFASPSWDGELRADRVDAVLSRLQSPRIRRFEWNVRYDQEPLARELSTRLHDVTRPKTHVLTLGADYEQTFTKFNATIRNQVRRAHKSGVSVTNSVCAEKLASYYSIHERLAASKGGYNFVFPLPFLQTILQSIDSCRLFTASVDGKIAAGGVFLVDGDSLFYFHGAHDGQFSKQFPMCAVLDEAVKWAHSAGVSTVNLGGSAGIETLEKFKSFWGSVPTYNWRFTWRNPLWSKLEGAKKWIKNVALGR